MPCSPLKVNIRFGGNVVPIFRIEEQGKQETSTKQAAGSPLAAYIMLVYFFAYSLILKMEAICSSDTSVDFQRTT
jgi:hypothetical protein